MTSIPIAWLISIFALLLAAIVARQTRMPYVAKLSLCLGLASIAVVAGFVGIRFQFNDPSFIVLQPYLAAITAPALWLGFHVLKTERASPSGATLAGVAGIVACAWLFTALPFSPTASLAVMLVNMIFAVRLFALWRLPEERFVHVSPQGYESLRLGLIGSLAFLLLIVVIDASVLATSLATSDAQAMALLSDAALVVVVPISLGVVIGLAWAIGGTKEAKHVSQPPSQVLNKDRAIVERLNMLMADVTLYRDPDLTVARLGRRLGVPARAVSHAINRVTGENASRFVNQWRVQHAIALLETTNLPVTDVMLESGFISKSSFNTEFRRITGRTPSEHRKTGAPVA